MPRFTNFFERFTALLECTNENAWLNSILKMGKDFGFEQTLIAVAFKHPSSLNNAFYRGNFSPKWLDVYARNRFISIDPRITHSLTRSTPLLWGANIFPGKLEMEMYEEASRHGIRSGITFPCHGSNGEVGMLSFANDKPANKYSLRDTQHISPALSLMRDFVFESSMQFSKTVIQDSAPTLTSRELECLKWCASGKTSWEIAKILSCSEATVNFHFGNLRKKFNATSRRNVLVKAIRYGLLNSRPHSLPKHTK